MSEAAAQSAPSAFDRAMAWLLDNEGREYVNDPRDSGGPTKFGITLRTLAAHRGRDVTAVDVEALTLQEAALVYHDLYWRPLRLGELPPQTALAMFDVAVVSGPKAAIRVAQRAMGVKDDGILGPATIKALQRCGWRAFLLRFVPLASRRFVAVVKYDPTKLCFLEGWIVRACRLLSLLEN